MKKIYNFLKLLISRSNQNDLFLMSSALTYRLVVSIFPFTIFIITLLGFFNLQGLISAQGLAKIFPTEVPEAFEIFFQEVFAKKRISLLSSSFILATYSASTGFYYIIRVLNLAYEQKETRSFLKVRLISVLLVFIFAILVNVSLVLFVFSDIIKGVLIKYTIFKVVIHLLDSIFFYLFIGLILLCMILITYKISINKKLELASVLPGSIFTVIGWAIFSKIFKVYVNNFSKYSFVYGGIGGVLVFLLWINIVVYLFLIGGQINAILLGSKKLNYN